MPASARPDRSRGDDIIDAPGKPGRRIIEGRLLDDDHPVHRAYVGRPTPDSARVRNPVTYLDSEVGGWPCGCGCGTEIFVGEFVRGHEQTALHQRVARIGTIPEFLRWFDGLYSAAQVRTPSSTVLSSGEVMGGIMKPGKSDFEPNTKIS